MKYPKTIMQDLRQRVYGLDENDTSRDTDIETITPLAAFESVSNWRLGNGWGQEILWLLESCGLEVREKK